MTAITQDEGKCEHIAGILKTLGHPLRLRIVAYLCEGDMHVGAIAEAVGAAQAAVSQQLSVLRMRQLVTRRSVDGRAVYSLAEPRLRQLVSCMEDCRVQ